MTRARWMALLFVIGSTCFVVGPFPGYAKLVGDSADGWTFFIGSIFFTAAGAIQSWAAWATRHAGPTGPAGWQAAIIQSVGTVFFNFTTFRALSTAVSSSSYDRLVWRPDALGSVCFLISGVIAYIASDRHGPLPARTGPGWWQAAVNLLGCILFGISAVTGYATGNAGSLVSTSVSDWTTTLGAACFLACALTACGLGVTLKAPRLRKLRNIPREVIEAVEHEALVVVREARVLEHELGEVRAYVEVVTESVIEEFRTVE
jgi:hypothetical protein